MRCHGVRVKIAKTSANRGQGEPFLWPGYSLRPRTVPGESHGGIGFLVLKENL